MVNTFISFYMSYFPYNGKMVLDLLVARITAYPEIDGTFNVKIKLAINITPPIAQLYIDKLNIGWLVIISLNVTCSRHDIPEKI